MPGLVPGICVFSVIAFDGENYAAAPVGGIDSTA